MIARVSNDIGLSSSLAENNHFMQTTC